MHNSCVIFCIFVSLCIMLLVYLQEELNCEELNMLTSHSTQVLARHCHQLQV